MANSSVVVRLTPGVEVELATNNPNIGGLVDGIVANKDSIDVDGIEVVCEDKGFDTTSFAEVVKGSVRKFLEAIELEKQTFDNVLAEIKGSGEEANE